jgi:hypothetical protein
MSSGFWAGGYELDILRAVFGREVRSVTFYDAEDARDGFELAVAHDSAGRRIGSVRSCDSGWVADHDGVCLGDIPGERGQTVKFFLEVPEGDEGGSCV